MTGINPWLAAMAVRGRLSEEALSVTYARLPVVNVLDHGVKGDGTTDDTAAFVAAIDAAKTKKRTLVVPPGLTGVRLTATVDARFVNINAESPITIAQTTGVGLWIGDDPNLVNHRQISLMSVNNTTGPDPTYPSVRVTGLKGAEVRIRSCDYLQLYADYSDPMLASVAYNKFHFGRMIRKHEVLGVNGGAWINENTFYGGSIRNIVVSTTGLCDSNLWHKPSIENPDGGSGASVTFNQGAFNRLEGMRGEAGVSITFGADTFGNIVTPSYGSNRATVGYFGPVSDSGAGNTVTGYQPFSRAVELIRVDSNSKVLDSTCDWSAPSIPTPGLRKLVTKTAWGTVIDTGLIPLRTTVPGNIAYDAPDLIRRLVLASSDAIWFPYVTLYDANRQRIDLSVGGPYMDTIGGWQVIGTAPTNRYGFQTGVSVAKMLIMSSTVAFMRVEVQCSTAGTAFSWLSLDAHVPAAHYLPGLASFAQRGLRRPLYQTTAPTKGAAYVGEKVANTTGWYTCTLRVDQTITAGVATGGTVLPFAGQAGALAAGDVVGLLLDNGTTHWAKVSSVSIPNVTIDTALPSAAAAGNTVIVNRWA